MLGIILAITVMLGVYIHIYILAKVLLTIIHVLATKYDTTKEGLMLELKGAVPSIAVLVAIDAYLLLSGTLHIVITKL